MSSQGNFDRPPSYSNSVTTGQGGRYDFWAPKGVNSCRLGNKRAPIPTCGIPVTTFSNASRTLPADKDQDVNCLKASESQTGQFGNSVQLILPNGHCLRSSSAESTQQHIDNPITALSDDGSLLNSDDSFMSDEDDEGLKSDGGLRRSHRGQSKVDYGACTKDLKEKKKVGRPIAYRGDPNAPELSELEKRRIKRRIANRESARRVRHKRQEVLDDLQLKMEILQEQNAELRAQANETRLQKEDLSKQLEEVEGKYQDLKITNVNMQQEIEALRASLQMKMTALECELDRRDNEAEMMEGQSAFAAPPPDCVSGYTQQPTYPFPSNHMDFNTSQSLKIALDWFPSLNLDESRPNDMMNGILTDGNFNPRSTPVKEEILR